MEVKGRNIWIGVSEMDVALESSEFGFSWACCHAQRLHALVSCSQTWWRRGASAAGPPPE